MIEKKAPLWDVNGVSPTITRKSVLGELIVLSAFFLYCVKYSFDSSAILVRNESVNSILLVISVGLPVLKIVFLQRYSLLRIIVTAVAAVAVCLSCLLGGNFLFLNGFLFILAMQDIDFDKVVRLGFWFMDVSLGVRVLWYIVLYITSPESIDFIYRTAGEPRHYFLLGHPNMFMAMLVWSCFEFIYLNYNRVHVRHFVVMWVVNLAFYVYTDSNTGLVVLAVVSLLVTLDKKGRGYFDKLLKTLAKYTYAFCATLFSMLAIVYTWLAPAQRAVWLEVDALLTGRMWYGAYAFDQYGVTLMGRQIDFPTKIFWADRWFDGFAYFDNYYHGNLFLFGIIHLALTALVFIVLAGKMETRDKIIVDAFSLYGGMESYVTNVLICFALLVVGKYLYLPSKKPDAGGPGGARDARPNEKGPLWKRPLA